VKRPFSCYNMGMLIGYEAGLAEGVMIGIYNVMGLAVVLVAMVLLSYLAVRADMRRWRQTRHLEDRRREQQIITAGRPHLR
jgi:hypothetical protein